MATSLKDFLGDLTSEIVGELFSVRMLKGILAKSIAERATPRSEAKAPTAAGTKDAGSTKPADDKTAPVTHGGVFDYSDEEAFVGLLARMSADPSLVGAAQKVSAFMNAKLTIGQRRKFRAVVGNVARLDFTADGKTKSLGVEFIRSFATYDEATMLDVCKASGILDSTLDGVTEGVKQVADKVGELAEATKDKVKAFEQRPDVQAHMTNLIDKMRTRREVLAARKQAREDGRRRS